MMKMNQIFRFGILTFIGVMLQACVAPPHYDYTALNAANPLSVLVMPPTNTSPDVKATNAMLAQMTNPLAENGYYVVPVALMDSAFRENGIQNADDAKNIPTEKLRSIFGADAVLFTEIQEYGSSYKVISSETTVSASCKLVDLRSGTLLWEGSARASSAEQQNNNSGGLAGLLVQAIVTQIVNNATDASYNYAGVASQRLLSPRPAGLLPGPRSTSHGKTQK